jgi:hypothetical protein
MFDRLVSWFTAPLYWDEKAANRVFAEIMTDLLIQRLRMKNVPNHQSPQ